MFHNDKFHREAFARGGERGDVHVLRASLRHIQRSIRIQFVIILILFDTTDYRCYMVIVRYRSVCVQRK